MTNPTQPQEVMKKLKAQAREWLEALVVAFVLAMFVRTFFVQPFRIPTGSMRTTLIEGDTLLVNKIVYGPKIPFTEKRIPGLRQPRRGDVIVFVYPVEPNKDFIKRLVGLPGDVVEIKGGNVYVNDAPLTGPEFSQRYYYNGGDYGAEDKKITVPQDSYFVLGDNSARSHDSRYWGFVPKNNVVGRAMVIYWPPLRIRFIK